MKRPAPGKKYQGNILRARDFNTINEGLRAVLSGSGLGMTLTPAGLSIRTPDAHQHFREPAIIAEVHNTGVQVNMFEPVQLFEIPVGAQRYPDYIGRRFLRGGRPTESGFGRFAIAAERIATNRVGKCWVSGVCPAWIRRTPGGAWHWDDKLYYDFRFDRADTGLGRPFLELLSSGAAEVLFKWGYARYNADFEAWLMFSVIRFGQRTVDGVSVQHAAVPKWNAGLAQTIRFAHGIEFPHKGIAQVNV